MTKPVRYRIFEDVVFRQDLLDTVAPAILLRAEVQLVHAFRQQVRRPVCLVTRRAIRLEFGHWPKFDWI